MSKTAIGNEENPGTMRRPETEDVIEEIRVGVVLYGGVSLCVYINGVTQELLRAAEATAPESKDKAADMKGTRALYRKLAMLASDECDPLTPDRWKKMSPDSVPLKRRFVIDALSGTSAGGINAVFLAKALANGQPLDAIGEFWLDQGGLENLINDPSSYKDLVVKPEDPPSALLNGKKMYSLLLRALDEMDKNGGPKQPLVEELDLYITATDLAGKIISVPLADQVVREKDYHQAFKFVHKTSSTGKKDFGDFGQSNNPFLAFAARCSSSFPMFFEPMRGKDIGRFSNGRQGEELSDLNWKEFIKKNVVFRPVPLDTAECESDETFSGPGKQRTRNTGNEFDESCEFQNRPFGDGGILDNKPFTYIMESLKSRKSISMAKRILIYIDPSPEDLDQELKAESMDALTSLQLAVTLPMYETIREDVLEYIRRNKLVDKLDRMSDGIEADLEYWHPYERKLELSGRKEIGIREMLKIHGIGYGGYHRLRVDALADVWVEYFSKHLEWKGHTWRRKILQKIYQSWQRANYEPEAGKGKPTENTYLFEFDIPYLKRRLEFVLDKADSLLRMDSEAMKVFEDRTREILKRNPDGDDAREFRNRLRSIKAGLKQAHTALLEDEEKMFENQEDVVTALRHFKTNLLNVYHQRDNGEIGDDTTSKAGKILAQIRTKPEAIRNRDLETFFSCKELGLELVENFGELMQALRQTVLPKILEKVDKSACSAFEQMDSLGLSTDGCAADRTCKALRGFYDNFDHFDIALYPTSYCTNVGEGTRVAIHRISPRPTTSGGAPGNGSRPELMGERYLHFGAFLDRSWRKHDMLWGRLDAVAKVIDILLPLDCDPAVRAAIIAEGEHAVVNELINAGIEKNLTDAIGKASVEVARSHFSQNSKDGEATYLKGDTQTIIPREEINSLTDPLFNKLFEDFRQTIYQKMEAKKGWHEGILLHRPGEMDREASIKLASRGSLVLGKMLEGISRNRNVGNPILTTFIRLTRLVWVVVDFALPKGVRGFFSPGIVKITILLLILLWGIGYFFHAKGYTDLAYKATIFLGALYLSKQVLLRYVRNKPMNVVWFTLSNLMFMASGYILAGIVDKYCNSHRCNLSNVWRFIWEAVIKVKSAFY